MTSEPDADETSLIHLITAERANNDALELLADAMAETGTTYADLAHRVGVTPRTIGRMMQGRTRLTVEHLAWCLDAMGQRLTVGRVDRLTDPEQTEAVHDFAADLENSLHDADIDGYGDEGAGYDFEKQARLLIGLGYRQVACPECHLGNWEHQMDCSRRRGVTYR